MAPDFSPCAVAKWPNSPWINKYSRGSQAEVWSERTLEARGSGAPLLEMNTEGLEGIELSGPPRSGHCAVEKGGLPSWRRPGMTPGLERSPSDYHASFVWLTPLDSSIRQNVHSSEKCQTVIILDIFDSWLSSLLYCNLSKGDGPWGFGSLWPSSAQLRPAGQGSRLWAWELFYPCCLSRPQSPHL